MAASRVRSAAAWTVVVIGVNISEISCCCFLAGAVGLGGGVVDDGIVFEGWGLSGTVVNC